MNRTETLQILSVLKAAYPSFYRDMQKQELNSIANLWTEMFTEDDYNTVSTAVRMLIETKTDTWPPNIGQVRAQIAKLTQPQDRTEMEAWTYVLRAIRNSIYGAVEEFAGLPDDVRAGVGRPEVLREWAMADESDLRVIESNFMRSYRARREQAREHAKLSPAVRDIVQQICARMDDKKRLEGTNNAQQIRQSENGN